MDCFVRDWKETLFLLISVMKIPVHKLHYQMITCQVFNIFLSQQGSSSTSITVHWQWGRRLCSWVCRDDQKTASCCKKRSPSNSRCRKRRFGWSSEFTGRRYYQPNWSQWSCREKTEGTNSFQQSDKIDYGMPAKDSTVSKSQPLMESETCWYMHGIGWWNSIDVTVHQTGN